MRSGSECGKLLVVDVKHCWCAQCENEAAAAVRSGSGHTHASAMRATHDLVELERMVFETASVHGAWLRNGSITDEEEWDEARGLDWSSSRVPALYLRRYTLTKNYLNNDQLWLEVDEPRGPEAKTPAWLHKVRARFAELREHGLLDAVLAPFSTTLMYVTRRRNERVWRAQLHERVEHLRKVYNIDVPPAVLNEPRKHRMALALFLRVCTAYDLIACVTGCAWDFHRVDVNVPYTRNTLLQGLALYAQLFANTHLYMQLACELHNKRFDDLFLSSCLADSNDESAAYQHSNAAPLALTMSFAQRFYPHPVRCAFGGELSNLGTPLYATDASANNYKTQLDAVTNFIFLKMLPYRAMVRAAADKSTQLQRDYPAVKQWLMNAIQVSQAGLFGTGAHFRPLWRAQLTICRSFAFDELKFEPLWCPSCGTGSDDMTPKFFNGNACPQCKPVQKAVWCVNECMRSEFKLAEEMDEQEERETRESGVGRGPEVNARGGDKGEVAHRDKVRKLELDTAYEHMRAELGQCPHCEREQQRRRDNEQLRPLMSFQLLEYHLMNKHICDFCKRREHDDVAIVRQATKEASKLTKKVGGNAANKEEEDDENETVVVADDNNDEDDEAESVVDEETRRRRAIDEAVRHILIYNKNNKLVCSFHVCDPCRMMRDNDFYVFYALKEALVFMIECDGATEDFHAMSKMWDPYKRILREGMDEIRSLINARFALNKPCEYVAFRSITERMWDTIREHVHLVHRCAQPVVTTVYKKAFIKLLKEKLNAYNTKHFFNALITQPQRATDFLKNPELVMQVAKDKDEAESEETKRARESIERWRKAGYEVSDVRKVAELAAEIALSDEEDRPCPIFFDLMRLVGMTAKGLKQIHSACYEREVCNMPDHRLEEDHVGVIADNSRCDFYLLQYFCEMYIKREPIRIFPLSLTAARAQMRALRLRNQIMPNEMAPYDIDVRYVCMACSKFYAPEIKPVCADDLKHIIDKGGDAAALSKEMRSVGHGALKHNLQTGELMCARDFKGATGKRTKAAGLLDLDFAALARKYNAAAQASSSAQSSAASVRKMRESNNACSAQPLTGIGMLGVMVRFQGVMYALCGTCGCVFRVTEGKLFADGVPTCGRHVQFGDPATYTSLSAFVSPLSGMPEDGRWLSMGHQLPHESMQQPLANLHAFSVKHIKQCTRPIVFEYTAPPFEVRNHVQEVNKLASEGWIQSSYAITHPKGSVEAMALVTIQRVFLDFGRGTRGMGGAAAAGAAKPTERELNLALVHCLMTYASAERRFRREAKGNAREYEAAAATTYMFDGAQEYAETVEKKRLLEDQQRELLMPNGEADDEVEGVTADIQLLPREVLEKREMIRHEMLARAGCVDDPLLIICAYCGSLCDKHGSFVRMEVLDLDRLCVHRYTKMHAVRSMQNESSKVEIFLCRDHFRHMEPLLCHYPTPTSAMVFLWLRCKTQKVLQKERFRNGASTDGASAADMLLAAATDEQLANTDLVLGGAKRARMAVTPTTGIFAMNNKSKRGRPPGSGRGGVKGSSGRKKQKPQRAVEMKLVSAPSLLSTIE